MKRKRKARQYSGKAKSALRFNKMMLENCLRRGMTGDDPTMLALRRRIAEAEGATIIERDVRQDTEQQDNDTMNRNQTRLAMGNSAAPMVPPSPEWWLRVRKQIITGGTIYPRGSAIPFAVLAVNARTLLDDAWVEWCPPSVMPSVQSYAQPPSAPPPPPNPAVEIIDDPDCVESWRKSLQAMTAKLNGNAAKAKDLLTVSPRGSELFLRATRVLAERNARDGVTPSYRRIPAL